MKWLISLLDRFRKSKAKTHQAADHRVVTLCNVINQKILDTAEHIITDHQRALLANSVEFVIGTVWASRPDKMTDLQMAIHKEISTSLEDIWTMVDLKELSNEKRLLFIYLVQTLVVYMLAYMTVNLKTGYGPALKHIPLEEMEPVGRA